MFLESQCIIDYSMLLGLHFRAPEHLKSLLEPQHAQHGASSSAGDYGIFFYSFLFPSFLDIILHPN